MQRPPTAHFVHKHPERLFLAAGDFDCFNDRIEHYVVLCAYIARFVRGHDAQDAGNQERSDKQDSIDYFYLIQPLLSARFEYQIKNAATTRGIRIIIKMSRGLKLIVDLAMPRVWISCTITPSSDAINK